MTDELNLTSGQYIIEVFHARTGRPVAQSSAEIREIRRMVGAQ